jgi:uncharacterized sodium:solute symporter family permease YidK
MFAADGLWQIIRLFTGFYNVPVIAIGLIGLFTRRVPALGLLSTITVGLCWLSLKNWRARYARQIATIGTD